MKYDLDHKKLHKHLWIYAGICMLLNGISKLENLPLKLISLVILTIVFIKMIPLIFLTGSKKPVEINDSEISHGKFRCLKWSDVDWEKAKISPNKIYLQNKHNKSANKIKFNPAFYGNEIIKTVNEYKRKAQ